MLRRFIDYYKPHRKLFFADLFFAFLLAVCDLFYPMIAKNIINEYVPDKNLRLLLIWSAVLLGIYLLKAGFNYFVKLLWTHSGGQNAGGYAQRCVPQAAKAAILFL